MNTAGDVTQGQDGSGYEVPILALEQALEIELRPENIERLDLGFEECEKLFECLLTYHQNNRIERPVSPDTVRPNLSFIGDCFGITVERDYPPYVKGQYIPRNGLSEVPTHDIKRSLLFADSAVIEDPVFAFCRGVMCRVYNETRPPFGVLKKALTDIAVLRSLLEERLLRITAFFPDPVENYAELVPCSSDGSIRVGDVLAATMYADPRVLNLVAGDSYELPVNLSSLPPAERSRILKSLMNSLGDDFEWLYRQAEGIVYSAVDPGAYSPYLPTDYLYGVYNKLIQGNARKLKHQLNAKTLMEINSGCVIASERIDIEELIRIRRNEEVFGTWREIVRQAVLNTQTLQYSEVEKIDAFKHELAEKERNWKATFQKYNKGHLADVITLGGQVSVNGIMTVITSTGSALVEPSGLLAFGSLCYGAYKSANKVTKELDRRVAEAAALSFFTAFREMPS